MTLDLYTPEQIARVLAALALGNEGIVAHVDAPADREAARIYCQAYADALRAVAVAFGITTPYALDVAADARRSVPARMLEVVPREVR